MTNPYFGDEDEGEDFHELWNPDPERKSTLIPFWTPGQLSRPVIDRSLVQLDWPVRIVEVIRFSALHLEYWVSPGGFIREWIRWNLFIALIFGASSVLLIPPMASLLAGGAEASVSLHEIMENVSKAALCLPPAVIAIAGLIVVFRLLQRFWGVRRRFDFDRYE